MLSIVNEPDDMNRVFSRIGRRIGEIQRALGYTNSEMAERLGVSVSTYSGYKNASVRIPSTQCIILIYNMDVNPKFLFSDSMDEKMFIREKEAKDFVDKIDYLIYQIDDLNIELEDHQRKDFATKMIRLCADIVDFM